MNENGTPSDASQPRPIASTGLDLLGVTEPPPGLVEELRGFDEIVSWYGTGRPEFREAVASLPFTFFPALPRGGSTHATDFYLEQARTIVPCRSDGVPRIRCEVARENFAAALSDDLDTPRAMRVLESVGGETLRELGGVLGLALTD